MRSSLIRVNCLAAFVVVMSLLSGCDKSGTNANTEEFRKTELPPLTGDKIRVVSHNMLFEYEEPKVEAQKWVNRLKAITDLYGRINADIIGSQELLGWQGGQLMEALGFEASGVNQIGHPEGSEAAGKTEYERIFYRPDRLEVVEEGCFWYSQTPDIPCTWSWDAGHTRSCCWARFREIPTGREFYVFNSHFHVDAPLSRVHSAELLLQKISGIASPSGLPVICTGDFNDIITSEPLLIITGSGTLYDSRAMTGNISGPVGTGHGFNVAKIPTRRIDHVFINDRLSADAYRVIDDELKTGEFCSDHLPVVVDLVLR